MPQLNETAKKIAQGHDILLIEGSIVEKEVTETVRKEIQDRIDQKIGNAPNIPVEKKPEKS